VNFFTVKANLSSAVLIKAISDRQKKRCAMSNHFGNAQIEPKQFILRVLTARRFENTPWLEELPWEYP
jgi:hypothetical protein